MSSIVKIKTKATNLDIIKRMAKQAGWGEVTQRGVHAVFTVKPGEQISWRTQVSINLQTGAALFDEDFPELRKQVNRINQEYEAASISKLADDLNYNWERTTNEEGLPVIRVDFPDSEMEVNYG